MNFKFWKRSVDEGASDLDMASLTAKEIFWKVFIVLVKRRPFCVALVILTRALRSPIFNHQRDWEEKTLKGFQITLSYPYDIMSIISRR